MFRNIQKIYSAIYNSIYDFFTIFNFQIVHLHEWKLLSSIIPFIILVNTKSIVNIIYSRLNPQII